MEYVRGPNLHPPWHFSWWAKQPGTVAEEYTRYSKREKLKQLVQIRFRFSFSNDLFRRRAGRIFHKDFVDPDKTGVQSIPGPTHASNGSGGYKVTVSMPNQESPRNRAMPRALTDRGDSVTQEDRLTARSLASENRSLLKKIRLGWLQNPKLRLTPNGSGNVVPQSISFLRQMCPGPSTTEVSFSIRC